MASVRTFCCVLFLVVFFNSGQTRKLPSYVKPCSLKDNIQQLSNCIAREMENLRPRLPQGIPEMHIIKLEPLLVKQAVLDSSNDLQVNFIDVNIYGLTGFKVDSVQFDIKNNFVKVDLAFDQVRGEGDYSIKGKLLFLNLNGAGRINGTFSNMKVTATLKGRRETIKGKEHANFDKIDIDLEIPKAVLYFDNLFENNEELTRATNQAINDNIKEILVELKPVVAKTVGDIVLSLVGSLFRRYSVDELFPES